MEPKFYSRFGTVTGLDGDAAAVAACERDGFANVAPLEAGQAPVSA